MRLGKIVFRLENYGGVRYFYARPVASSTRRFPARVGFSQVVYVEKNKLTEDFELGEVYETYALFKNEVSLDSFNSSVCVVTCTPITKEAFIELKGNVESPRDFEHAFSHEEES